MGLWQRLINRFTADNKRVDTGDAEALRLEFQSRYHHFKLLLNANNQALEIMADLELSLAGDFPFGMKFIRSRAMGAYTRVYQIVQHLHELAPGKYKALSSRLDAIRQDLDAQVNPRRPVSHQGPLILPFSDMNIGHADQVGMKMANLGEMANRLQIRVPDGFVITARAFHLFLDHNDLQTEIRRRIQVAEEKGPHQLYTVSADVRKLIQAAPLPPELESAIMKAYEDLAARQEAKVRLAVRSSALNEDREGASFAGVYQSALNIEPEHLPDTYKQIVAAAYSPSVMSYCLNRGICGETTEMCVGVMQMVDAVSGGVLYTANPMNIRDRSVIVNAAWGLPKAVVEGTTATDLFRVAKEPEVKVIQRQIATKEKKYVCYPDEGVCRLDDTGPDMSRASLTDRQAVDLAGLALRIEETYGKPQDIEWAIDGSGDIVLLQCRPLQVVTVPNRTTESGDNNLPPSLFQGGITASPGVAAGRIHLLLKDVDALQFPDGGVIVTDRALARWAALLPRASAVVSEKGSLTGHLANVAREFNVPALFAAEGAIERLSGAAEVTVDADAGRIYPGTVPALLTENLSKKTKTPMKGTPLYEVLEKAAGLITPLNLLDPDSPSFTAANCRTLHDITRFCHEKSVHEMFRFGKTHRFPERSSKQLRVDIPMQWWVLNLDDGFKTAAAADRYVDIDNVASIPMLALWEGISAYPWEGPPPVDGKGFMSVMFQATQNQALLPTVRTTMANRNYFMISKNYCSLQSRLGFHFAITEALVGDRAPENYISFQFKGGAADFNRRLKRVHLVKELLDSYGFRSEIAKDALRSRIEQHNAATMADKLKILGYLTIHTRQLDMVMANPVMLKHYREKMIGQIEAMLAKGSRGPGFEEPS